VETLRPRTRRAGIRQPFGAAARAHWIGLSEQTSGARWLARLIAIGATAACLAACSRDEAKVVSLLDQVPEEERAGPWRVLIPATNVLSLLENSDGLRVDGSTAIQIDSVSSVRIPAAVYPGETVVLRVRRVDQFALDRPEIWVQVRLMYGGIALGASRKRSLESSIGLLLGCPAAGMDAVELCYFMKPGTPLPQNLVAALAVTRGTGPADHERARALLRYRLESFGPADALLSRRLPFRFDGCAKNAIVLVSPDSWTCHVPHGNVRRRLRFWMSGLRINPESDVVLAVEAEAGGRWHGVGRWVGESLSSSAWQLAEVGEPRERSWSRIRVSVTGEDAIVAVGDPVLLPEHGTPSRRRNLILVDLDTMRADRLGCYGYKARPTSARLDSLLEVHGFFVFTRAYSGAPTTLLATAKFLTSRYFLSGTENAQVPLSYTTLAEILRAEGYYCVGFTGGGALRFPGLDQGFHEYYWDQALGKVERVFPPAKRWLHEGGARPFFLFVHTYESHTPYLRDTFCHGMPHGRLGDISKGELLFALRERASLLTSRLTEGESTYVQAAYDGGVHSACEATAELLGTLDELGLWENSIVVVLSDHGEEFWDHSDAYASHPSGSVYAEVLNVPFMICSPEQKPGGVKTVGTHVSTVDLVPTLLELLDLAPLERTDGTSLVPLMRGETIDRAKPLLATNSLSFNRGLKVCAYAHGVKYITPVDSVVPSRYARLYPWEEELFVLSEDPREKDNVVRDSPVIALEMAALVDRELRVALGGGAVQPAPDTLDRAITPELREQLAALGYVD
jgi:arylsulfatase A-like enzyme